MLKAFEVSKDQNLNSYGRLLWQRKISQVIQDTGESWLVAVEKPGQIDEALQLFRQWQSGEIQVSENDSTDVSAYFNGGEFVVNVSRAFMRAPLTLSLVAICLILFLLTFVLGNSSLFDALLFPDFAYGTRTLNIERVLDNFTVVQFLKMISPILLHGGYLHIAFNMLWLWEFGKRIEAKQVSWIYGVVIIVIALVSNTAQYILSGTFRFVGISGVVYGLFAYIWMWQLFDPQKGIRLEKSLIIMILVLLGIMTFLNLSIIADEAHIAGLLCGVVVGAFLATISRINRAVKK